jgi:hypothetical protein
MKGIVHPARYCDGGRAALAAAGILLFVTAGCASRARVSCTGPTASGNASSTGLTATAAPTEPALEWNYVESSAKNYVVAYRTNPPRIPLNEPFSMEARVFASRDRDTPLKDVTMTFDAAMPEHSHGMNRIPRIRSEEGLFKIDNILLHMSGAWQMYFDIKRSNVSERAAVSLELE